MPCLERVYDGFWTQTSLRILEFSDMPLEDIPDADTYCDFFPAKYVGEYLKKYVDRKVFDEQSLASRIVLNTTVDTVTKVGEGWIVRVTRLGRAPDVSSEMTTRRVIDATGLTSSPNVPSLPGQDRFKGVKFHSKDFARFQKTSLYIEGCQKIAVIGGAKSAADIAYTCAKAGHQVTWIIRRGGAGPAAFVSAEGRGPYKNSNESFYTRFTAHFLASYFFNETKTWLGQFLYKSWLGREFLQRVWKSVNAKVHALANYERKDGKANGFFHLRSETDIFWQNDSTGIYQRPDFFDTVAHNVKVYREDVKLMTENGIELADGISVAVDTVIFATGWKTSHPKLIVKEAKHETILSLGLPEPICQEDTSSKAHWAQLESTAHRDVLARFPILRDQPSYHRSESVKLTPFRLYKGVLPINERSIAFVGQVLLGNNFRVAEVQALYVVAAFDDCLRFPTRTQMETTIAQIVAWDRLRYLSKGRHGSWLYWDMVPYTDDLLEELGLTSHRHQSYWKDLLTPCYAMDLRNLIKEYKAKN